MIRAVTFFVAWLGVLALLEQLSAAPMGAIVDQAVAARHGLHRAWYAQVQMDRSQSRITHMVLREGTLFVQTNRATVNALGAETGQTLWTTQMGTPGSPDMPIDAHGDYVALVNGTTLFILNRFDGRLLWQKKLEGVAGAGPGLSDQHVYVPMLDGAVYAYPLKPTPKPALEMEGNGAGKKAGVEEKSPVNPDEVAKPPVRSAASAAKTPGRPTASEAADAAKPKSAVETPSAEDEQQRRASLRLSQDMVIGLNCRSIGQVITRPLVTMQATGEEAVAWATSKGYLYMSRLFENRFSVTYRLSTGGPMSAEPSYLPADVSVVGDSGLIYGTSEDGFVYAIRENTGTLLWRFSTSEPIVERSAVVGLRIFVPTQLKGMYCLNAETGEQLWWTPGIRRFVAASKDRLYTVDEVGRIVVLNAQTGARLDSFNLNGFPYLLCNEINDRIYLASPTGLVQCIHEIDLVQPLHHREVLGQQRTKAAEVRAVQEEAAKAKAAEDAVREAASMPEDGQAPEGQSEKQDDNPFN